MNGAIISPDGVYRYVLWRGWDTSKSVAAWIMLNPSTADAETDDPTIRRCMRFTRAWGLGGLVVVNLFALRSSDPEALGGHPDPIGSDNDAATRHACNAQLTAVVIAAWGAHTIATRRQEFVLREMRRSSRPTCCLGRTKEGYPRHPLYVAAATKLQRFALPTTYR